MEDGPAFAGGQGLTAGQRTRKWPHQEEEAYLGVLYDSADNNCLRDGGGRPDGLREDKRLHDRSQPKSSKQGQRKGLTDG